jgi:hypothetical protein
MWTIAKKDAVYARSLFYGIKANVHVVIIDFDLDLLEEPELKKGIKNWS